MTRHALGPYGLTLGQLACTVVALVALYAFFQDFINPNWPAAILAALLVIAFGGAISAAPRGGMARALLWQGALIIVPFMGIYGLLDLLFSSDAPVWVLSPLIVLGFWVLFSRAVATEANSD